MNEIRYSLLLCCLSILACCIKSPSGNGGQQDNTPSYMIMLDRVTASTASFTGCIHAPEAGPDSCQVTLYYSDADSFSLNDAEKVNITSFDKDMNFKTILKDLDYGTKYRYCLYVADAAGGQYTEVEEFETNDVETDIAAVQSVVVSEYPVVEFRGNVSGLLEEDKSMIRVGVVYSQNVEELVPENGTIHPASEFSSDWSYTIQSEPLVCDSKYYYCSFVKQNGNYVYGDEIKEFQTTHPYNAVADLELADAADLSSSGSANCYIVSQPGLYKFSAVKGNSNSQLSDAVSCSIVWETFGTVTRPQMLDLISEVCYKDGYVAFRTNDTFKEGNALLAVKDADGTIQWSWHIWFTDQPESQEYFNNAGTMMDRNLGAVSAAKGDVGALGLLYQWGRKDPFMGACKTSSGPKALTTITWPSRVPSVHAADGTVNGTIEYAVSHPTTFICYNNINLDWYYTGDETTDDTRWTTSQSCKSVYDPCPPGWRVPDGGDEGVWTKALGTGKSVSCSYDGGVNLTGHYGASSSIWYPATDCLKSFDGSISSIIYCGYYWSATPAGSNASGMFFNGFGSVKTDFPLGRAAAFAIRCIHE